MLVSGSTVPTAVLGGGMPMIEVHDVTLAYPSGKGVFDLQFAIEQGVAMGYLGPNGAGKTTTIRALLGFMRPNKGICTIAGLDCMQDAPDIQKRIGYIPGEISFIDGMHGDEFLRFMFDMREMKDDRLQKQLLDMFDLDPRGNIRKFSKGMKQKLGIVTAFMHDPEVLILDEPTSGLDPLMQQLFVELILENKKRGKTILMSSHSFKEVESTCDHVIIIKDGRIINQSDVQTLKKSERRGYVIQTDSVKSAVQLFAASGFEASAVSDDTLEVFVTGDHVDQFVKTAANITVRSIDVTSQSLEDIFMQFYARKEQ